MKQIHLYRFPSMVLTFAAIDRLRGHEPPKPHPKHYIISNPVILPVRVVIMQ